MSQESDDWTAYRRLVIATLDRFEERITALTVAAAELDKKITVLKTTVAVWGAVAGVVASIITSVAATLVVKALTGDL